MVDDNQLVSAVRNGDMQAFKVLIDQNQRLVAHMVGRLIKNDEDREELCQDVFVKVHQKLSEFNFKSKLSTWIATIAYRLSINHLQKKNITIEKDIQELSPKEFQIMIENTTPLETLQEKDVKQFLLAAIEQMPVHYKSVVTLFHLEDMGHSEIAEIMDMPVGTVKNYLFRARKLLKDSLQLTLDKEELI
ncbi:sigma-70 family RNA polymerase sigma factor [Fulvivirga sp.]|uniref:RNA polymerase sigma factor n=1 Tax=Fulvivirga sp. TaxID=1931237 RepID=UPI0032ED8E1D